MFSLKGILNYTNFRRVISVKRSNTLQPELNRFQQHQRDPESSSRLTHRFDVTTKQQKMPPMGVKGPTSLATDVTDLNLMVRGTGTGGQVSSVCSQVEAPRTVDQVSAVIEFQFTVQSRFSETLGLRKNCH